MNTEPELPPVEAPAPVTPEDMAAKAHAFVQGQWDSIADNARAIIAKRKGLFSDPSVQPTLDELRAAVPLEGDTLKYKVIARGRLGTLAFPKQTGRRRPHMTKHAQHVKSESLRVFRHLFTNHVHTLEILARKAGEPFNGVPADDLPKLGARAAVLAAKAVKNTRAERRRRARNQQKLSRRINAGVVAGNINVGRYIG